MTKAYVSNPNAEIVDRGDRLWIVFGTHAEALSEGITGDATFEAIRSRLTSSPGEGTIACISSRRDEPGIRAHRGITSAYELFYCLDSSGEPIVTDLFRNALACLDVADRTVPERAIADHVLYRTAPIDTYVERVDRLGHGETLAWSPESGDPRTDLVERIAPEGERTVERAVLRLDESLAKACRPVADDATLMLSGGVDSTVLANYLREPTESVSAAFDTPEFDFEVEYARTASDLVGTDHEIVEAPEDRYLERLEAAVDALGMPPHQLQTPTFDAVFREHGDDTFVCGQGADALFGLGGAVTRARKVWLTRHLKYLPSVVEPLRHHGRYLERLERDASDPRGEGPQFAAYTDLESATEIVGREAIERRQRARYEYALERVPEPSGDPYARHMHVGHWIDFFCEDAITVWRQVGLARGCEMHTPFAGKDVASLAAAVPSPERYVDRFEAKHLPKKLVDRHYPEYDQRKPKGNGNLPVERFFESGPLADVFDRYPLPSFVPESVAEDVPDRLPGFAWNLAGYAIWRDRVLRNDDLAPAPNTRSVTIPSSTVRSS